MTVEFEIDGQHFTALNGGPDFKFNESVSFQVFCKDQAEIDYYWTKLSQGGQIQECGWLKDKFGLSWQIVPVQLMQHISGPDAAKASRVMQAMLTMKKIDIPTLKRAYEGRSASAA